MIGGNRTGAVVQSECLSAVSMVERLIVVSAIAADTFVRDRCSAPGGAGARR